MNVKIRSLQHTNATGFGFSTRSPQTFIYFFPLSLFLYLNLKKKEEESEKNTAIEALPPFECTDYTVTT